MLPKGIVLLDCIISKEVAHYEDQLTKFFFEKQLTKLVVVHFLFFLIGFSQTFLLS